MYDGVLRHPMPANVHVTGFADDVTITIVTKTTAEVENMANTAVRKVELWLSLAGLQLAAHKTEAVLISSRKLVETVRLTVGGVDIVSQRALKYLGVMIDSRLSYKEHLEYANKKAAASARSLARILLNTRGPKHERRKLIESVVTSQVLYAAPVWAYAALYRLFDEHVSLSSMTNSYSSPWITRQLAYLKNKKTRLFKRFKISSLQTDFTKYSSAKAEFVQYNSDCYNNDLSRCKRDFKSNPKLLFFRQF